MEDLRAYLSDLERRASVSSSVFEIAFIEDEMKQIRQDIEDLILRDRS